MTGALPAGTQAARRPKRTRPGAYVTGPVHPTRPSNLHIWTGPVHPTRACRRDLGPADSAGGRGGAWSATFACAPTSPTRAAWADALHPPITDPTAPRPALSDELVELPSWATPEYGARAARRTTYAPASRTQAQGRHLREAGSRFLSAGSTLLLVGSFLAGFVAIGEHSRLWSVEPPHDSRDLSVFLPAQPTSITAGDTVTHGVSSWTVVNAHRVPGGVQFKDATGRSHSVDTSARLFRQEFSIPGAAPANGVLTAAGAIALAALAAASWMAATRLAS